MIHDMSKPTKWVCAQRRLRSAWADAQTDLSLRWAHHQFVGFVMSRLISSCAQRRLIRLGRCPDWSKSSLDAPSFCWFCHVTAQIVNMDAYIFSFIRSSELKSYKTMKVKQKLFRLGRTSQTFNRMPDFRILWQRHLIGCMLRRENTKLVIRCFIL